MKCLNIFFLLLLSPVLALGQSEGFIQIETNKVLCLFSFVETASSQMGASQSYQEYISQELKDPSFIELVDRYSMLSLNDSGSRDGYPRARHNYINIKDLLWTASSNATDITDFSERILGYLPHDTHVELIEILRDLEPYYDRKIWNKEQDNIARMEAQLQPYKAQVEKLFFRVADYYGTHWSQSIPFKISLYPIPLEAGVTTAIPKGNALICGYLSHNEDDYTGTLSVAVHEMCHILFDAQSKSLQNDINKWYVSSSSRYAALAYSYINEGLATALGNGWAYKELEGELDPADWYNDAYINGFAKEMYPLVERYMEEGISMDSAFVIESIGLFEIVFPNSIYNPETLMADILLFANTEEEEEINDIIGDLQSHFSLRSLSLSTPIYDPESIEQFANNGDTKVFLIESDRNQSLEVIKSHFDESIEVSQNQSGYYSFYDQETSSQIVILHLAEGESRSALLKGLANIGALAQNQWISM